ncbi:MAG: sugar phosphate nucleotidyltransferase [Candidatus Margulisiibacteriota bacterium]
MHPLFKKAITDCNVQDIAMALMVMPKDVRDYYGPNMSRLRNGTGSSFYWQHQSDTVNLNTAGCVVRGWQADIKGKRRSDTFIILSADIRSNANIGKMMEMHKRKNALITIALAPVPWKEVEAERFGVVFLEGTSFDEKGRQLAGSAGEFARIVRFQEKDKHAKSNLNNASIYIVSERLMRLIEGDIEVTGNRNQLDPKAKARYVELRGKKHRGKDFSKEEQKDWDRINPYELPIPGIDGDDKPFDLQRGNYANDWTEGARHFRLGVFSKILTGKGLLPEEQANKNYQDWGGHIFPEVASHHPEIYESKRLGEPSGFYGYLTRSLWADDGTRSAILQANMEMLVQEGGLVERGAQKFDFSWWPKPERISHDSNGRPIWLGDNVTIEEGAQIFGPAFIGSGAVIKRGSVVANAIVGAKWVIDGGRVFSSVLWPDRSTLGLDVIDPNLEYTLRGINLENSMVGGGFHRNGPRNVLCFDTNGRYDVQVALDSHRGLITLKNRVVVPNPLGTIVTKLDLSAKEPDISVRTPEIEQLSTEAIREKAISAIKTGGHILVVDDDSDFLTLTVEELKKAGWQNIHTAASPAEAEATLSSRRFDFILLDSILRPELQINNIEETDGVALLKKQKQDPGKAPNYQTPILMWSSFESIVALKGLNTSEALKFGGREVDWREKEDKTIKELGLSEFILQTILKS